VVRVPRITVEKIPAVDQAVEGFSVAVPDSELHHLRSVLRLPEGSAVELIESTSGNSYHGKISYSAHGASLVDLKCRAKADTSQPAVSLIIGRPKQAACEEIVEKAAEIGVKQVVFFNADRSQGRLSAEDWDKRSERLKRIAETAIKQSGARAIPTLTFCAELEEAFKLVPENAVKIALTPPQDGSELINITGLFKLSGVPLPPTRNQLQKRPDNDDFFLLLGPEGGLADGETKLASSFGFISCSLGPRVLRTSTSATAAAAVVMLLAEQQREDDHKF
jgi:16S rRNA (uracil1498-N3)-methyltransferase